nr:MAG TPA: hypothetical protein [Caudoviricetes sp.]
MSQSPDQQEEPRMKTQWTGRVVTDEADVEIAAA